MNARMLCMYVRMCVMCVCYVCALGQLCMLFHVRTYVFCVVYVCDVCYAVLCMHGCYVCTHVCVYAMYVGYVGMYGIKYVMYAMLCDVL